MKEGEACGLRVTCHRFPKAKLAEPFPVQGFLRADGVFQLRRNFPMASQLDYGEARGLSSRPDVVINKVDAPLVPWV